MKPTPPCLDCPDRQIGCHAVCEAYKAFRSALDDYNETVRDALKADRQVESRMIQRNIKNRQKNKHF